ncbi:MAG: NAD(P)H-dependent glycerol-3-phosphate dehydrogenase [Pseudanabaenaceae cyanobacterium bins.68]|nr:NAD(P)H-dependent glycerol-3-phosphate dehydrogenase [Pseudanabaenaceae cyanobacterium bins.68]
MARVLVLGAGTWGKTLGSLLCQNGHQVSFYSRQTSQPLAELIAGQDFLVSAVAIAGVLPLIAQIKQLDLDPKLIFVSATKGLEPGTRRTALQLWQAALGDQAIAVLSGPNLSQEIAAGLPCATVVASASPTTAQEVQSIFANRNFRVYTNDDPLGVELGGTLKNVIAIAVGVCDGLQLGANAKAALTTRALIEIIRVGSKFGAQPQTFWGLSGLGDLLATCNSSLSRNYRVGYGLAQGKNLAQALQEIEGTAEGVNTAQVIVHWATQHQISVPICSYVQRLLAAEISPQEAVEGLMERELKAELPH